MLLVASHLVVREFFHEKKYFLSWRKIFFIMKINLCYHENKSKTTYGGWWREGISMRFLLTSREHIDGLKRDSMWHFCSWELGTKPVEEADWGERGIVSTFYFSVDNIAKVGVGDSWNARAAAMRGWERKHHALRVRDVHSHHHKQPFGRYGHDGKSSLQRSDRQCLSCSATYSYVLSWPNLIVPTSHPYSPCRSFLIL